MSVTPRIRASIFPSLTYADAPAAIEWLCAAFGFRRRLVVPNAEGGVRHSELSLEDGVILVSSSRPEEGCVSPRQLPAVAHALCVFVADPDLHHDRARAAGATILQDPHDTDFGARIYLVEDLEGHRWCFGNYRPGEHWEDPAE